MIDMRQAIVLRRIEFDQNPEVFSKKWSVSETLLSEQIAIARSCIGEITIPDAMLALAVRLSLEVKVQGHRSDIIILKAAKAMAAILEKKTVERAEVIEAARFALPHRITGALLSTSENLHETLDEAIAKVTETESVCDSRKGDDAALDCWYEVSTQVPGHVAASSTDMIFSLFEEKKKLFLKPMKVSVSVKST